VKPRPPVRPVSNAILNACVSLAIDATKPQVQKLVVGRTFTGVTVPTPFDPQPAAEETVFVAPEPADNLASAFEPVQYVEAPIAKPACCHPALGPDSHLGPDVGGIACSD
jgi:hypothetical protein